MITLHQLKSFLSISTIDGTYDAMLQSFINDAVSELDALCSRQFEHCEHTDITNGSGGITLILSSYPVSDVTSIEVLIDDEWKNIFTDRDDITNSAIVLKELGIIKLLRSYIFPKGEMNIKVVYSAGYKYADDWQPNTHYSANELVRYNGIIY